ncbi:hypothetical protein AVEN_180544-1 [Araneus ventricosus]|uniref:Uncharacterized protein n=1 Tax=Araneus ventricosus TaxID=182803 RepID=A0A4Y2FLK2_ARAVE|nr:hypothetical protein AVEN_180544-1 [Araneus ventricosus]
MNLFHRYFMDDNRFKVLYQIKQNLPSFCKRNVYSPVNRKLSIDLQSSGHVDVPTANLLPVMSDERLRNGWPPCVQTTFKTPSTDGRQYPSSG